MDNVYISIDKETYRKFDDLTQRLNVIRKVFERDPQDDLTEGTSFSRDEIAGIYAFLNDYVTFCNELLVNTKFTKGLPPHTENKEQNNNLCCLVYDSKSMLSVVDNELHHIGIEQRRLDRNTAYGLHLILEKAIEKLETAYMTF